MASDSHSIHRTAATAPPSTSPAAGSRVAVSVRSQLTRELQNTGLTRSAIDAVWPEWWGRDAEDSPSANAELRYTISRRLGLAPSSLFDGPPRFVWRDNAKFKNVGVATAREQEILTSFGMAVGIALIDATPVGALPPQISPMTLRAAILERKPSVALDGIIETYWTLGIPVVKPRFAPLRRRRMQAMSMSIQGRYSALVSRSTRNPAKLAFILAHELGHIALGHVGTSSAFLEMEDPLTLTNRDQEEQVADNFALQLLIGGPGFAADRPFSGPELARTCLANAAVYKVDPGIMALSIGFASQRWAQAQAALRLIDGQELPTDVGQVLNRVASDQLNLEQLTTDKAEYLRVLIGSQDGD